MTNRFHSFLIVLIVSLFFVLSVTAQRRIRPRLPFPSREQLATVEPAQANEGPIPVIVWLEGQPLAEFHERQQPALLKDHRRFRMGDSEVQMQRARLADARVPVARRLSDLGFRQEGEVDVVLHALLGHLDRSQIAEASRVPGVRAVRPTRTFRLLLDGAVPLINAIPAWSLLNGDQNAGKGMRIAVIDTGVDINHPMLQDPSLTAPAGFPRGDAQLTNGKVIVARNYLSLLGEPRDLPSAMDRDGHGTFVSACAAGRRVVAPKATVVGVAPAAQIGNYRVFSSPLFSGTFGPITNEAAIVAAINDAVQDGMNVINLSIGGLPFDVPEAEPSGQAVSNATKAGVLVVAAAGNDGPDPVTVSSPANSPHVLAVGSSNNSRIFAQALRVTGPGTVPSSLSRIAAVAGDGPKITQKLSLPVWVVRSDPCSTLNPAVERVQDAVAVIPQSLFCSDRTMILRATTAGAKAVLFYDETNFGDPFGPIGVSTTTIPSFSLGRADGQALAAFFQSSSPEQPRAEIEVEITAVPVQPDRMSEFSSVGPDLANQLKPDLTAPGTSIYSAVQVNDFLGDMYDPSQYFVADGTSFSSPLTAGAAALVRQLRPTWTPAQAKSALVNSAADVVRQGAQQAPLLAAGNGRLDVAAAMRATAVFEPTTLSFGATVLTGPVTLTSSFSVTNLAETPETFAIELVPRTTLSNGSVTLSKSSVTLGPRESTSVQLTFSASGSVRGHAPVDGRVRVTAAGSGRIYALPYWGEVEDASSLVDVFRIRGQGQSGVAGQTLAQDLVAVVVDDDGPIGKGVAGVPVKFTVTKGGGRVSVTDAVTDFVGYASTKWTLGDAAGEQQVTVAAVNVNKIFYATARANPAFPAAGVVHAATFSTTLAPGGMVSLFGTRVASATASATSLPLAGLLAGAQVLVNGTPAPLFFASAGQINFQMPFELQGQTSAELKVSVLGISTPPVTIPLVAAAPGLFTVSQDGKGFVVALHGTDNTPVTALNPARAGETIVVYGTGLGRVTPAVASGAASPLNPAATTQTQATAIIGTNTARVVFSGLAPGFVGLYQINIEIPAATPAADVPLVVSIGDVRSNLVALPVR